MVTTKRKPQRRRITMSSRSYLGWGVTLTALALLLIIFDQKASRFTVGFLGVFGLYLLAWGAWKWWSARHRWLG
jgi:hypothetical protein